MNHTPRTRVHVALTTGLVAIMLYAVFCACEPLKRTGMVGVGAGAGAAVGSIAGPAGAIGGAAIGGLVTSAVVDSDRADKTVDRWAGTPQPAPQPRGPLGFLGIAWYWWALIALYVVYRNRAHIGDLRKKGQRVNAVLRMTGIRTHRSK
jgi:hypothetical protein